MLSFALAFCQPCGGFAATVGGRNFVVGELFDYLWVSGFGSVGV
jgi:hypothetical protein